MYIKRRSGQSTVETMLIISVISIAILYFFHVYLFDEASPVWRAAQELALDQAEGLSDAGVL